MIRIAVDIGGTFTDLVIMDEETGEINIEKVFTTPDDLSRGVTGALEKAGITDIKQVSLFLHATTVGSNTVIENKGAKTALLTTKGFRDVLEIRRGQKTILNPRDTYNLQRDVPQGYYGGFNPLVPRYLRYEVSERVSAEGKVIKEVREEEIKKIIDDMKKNNVESIAVVYLFSFLNPTNELKTREYIRNINPDIYISLSHEIFPRVGEYERTSTTVINSYLGPIVKKYIEKILSSLLFKGLDKEKFYIMQSNGGLMTPDEVIQKPVLIIESGPTAGVNGAAWLSKIINSKNSIYFDMGGTTAKAAIIRNFDPLLSREMWMEDLYYIGVPHIEVVEVGAGGGSIARVDDFGALKVGPQSAGAYPGPVCYHRGGTEPTVADADLILGYLDEDYFLGGEYKLDKNSAMNSIKEKIANRLNVSVIEAALFIYKLANVKMANAIRLASVRRGYDPAEHVLIVSGGAGPMHSWELAQELGIKKIVVPPHPGNFSALGLLTADIRYEEFKSKPANLYSLSEDEIFEIFNELESKVKNTLLKAGGKEGEIITYWQIDMRYSGQVHDVLVTVPKEKTSKDYRDNIAKVFSEKYFETYGYVLDKELIETVTFRVVGSYPMSKPRLAIKNAEERRFEKAIVKTKDVYFEKLGDFVNTNVFYRDYIPIHQSIKGPAIVVEKTSTTVIPPNAKFYIDDIGNIIIDLES